MKGKRRYFAILAASAALIALIGLAACSGKPGVKKRREITVFHAGSLSMPIKEIASAFEKENPDVTVLLEAAGSRACARKITDLGRRCDVLASADYAVIDRLLIPGFASWNIKFATNQMAIAYGPGSRGAERIDSDNWYSVLLDKDVAYGRSDPDSDPCGYRSVIVMKLAESYYGVPGLAEKMAAKDNEYIRPKETDLLALLESGAIDYIFIYRSVAVQHGLEYVTLPDSINLGDPDFAEVYAGAKTDISGKEPGKYMTVRGEPMVYGLTIPLVSENPSLAQKFVDFMLDPGKGMAIMEKNGQPSAVPSPATGYGSIPDRLKKYARPMQEPVGEAEGNIR